MRYIVKFRLNVFKLELDYRRLFISLIKNCIEKYNLDLFNAYYNTYTTKPYTFSVYLPKSEFTKNGIKLFDNYCYFYFTSSDNELSKNIMGELIKIGRYTYKSKISLEVVSISLDNNQFVDSNSYNFKLMSPLVVRKYIECSNTEVYLKSSSFEFIDLLTLNIKKQVNSYFDININTDGLIHQVIKHFDLQFNAYNGRIKLSSDNWVLNKLYQEGIGSRKSQGFGMLGL